MADLKTTDMKDENISSWKAQVLALYQSLVVFLLGTLRLMQEYFKTGDTKSHNVEKIIISKESAAKSKLRSAGEHVVEEGVKMAEDVPASAHTVVVLPPVVEPSPPISLAEMAKVEEPKENVAEPSGDQSKNTLVIKNLPFKFKQADLDKLLNDNHAKPKNVRLLRDESGRFSGMAFIRCPSKDEAQRLISSMNGIDVGGRSIQVEFKLKKKKSKGKLDASCDSLSSSSDELPGIRIHLSNETIDSLKPINEAPVQVHALVCIQPAVTNHTMSCANKLSTSAEHLAHEVSQPLLKKAFQPRRRSTSSTGEPLHYLNSALPRLPPSSSNLAPGIRPIRQPIGPDGSNGFNVEYRRSRGQV